MISGKLIAKNVSWNFFGRIIPLVSAIFSIPPLIRALGVEKFGILTLVWMIIGYFNLFDLGIGRALTKLISNKIGAGQKEDIPPLIWTGLILMGVFGCIGACVSAVLTPWLVNTVLKFPPNLKNDILTTFYLLSCSLPIVIITTGFRGILEAHQRFSLVNMINTPMGLYSFVAPLLVLMFSHDLFPIVIILVIGRLLGLLLHVIGCYYVVPEMYRSILFQRKIVSSLLRFGSWMTVTNIIGPFMVYFDRFMISTFCSMSLLAYYTTPYEVVSKLWIISGAIVGVLFPAFAMSFVQDRARMTSLFVKGIKYIFLLLFPITLIIVTLSNDILNVWLGSDFAQKSTLILQWLATGILINSIGQIPYTFIQSIGRPDLTAKLHLIELPVYLVLIWFMLKHYGIEGAAVAWTVRVTIDTVLLFSLAIPFMPAKNINKYKKKIITVAAVSLTIILLSTFLNGLMIKGWFLFFTVITYAVISWFVILVPEERKFTLTLWKVN